MVPAHRQGAISSSPSPSDRWQMRQKGREEVEHVEMKPDAKELFLLLFSLQVVFIIVFINKIACILLVFDVTRGDET